jgi:putative spermidine/putrescine transport system ATP-binding protein
MRGELRRIQYEFGITFIHVTHSQMEAIALADTVVVMDQGQIEQLGSARDVFDRPRTSYVARFIGGQNVVAGKVVERTDDTVVMSSGDRQIAVTSPDPAPPVAANFEIALRRDRIRLSRDSRAETHAPLLNSISGRVAAIEYQGSWLKISIEDACDEEFVVNVPDSVFFADPLSVGDPVLAQWDAAEIHFLQSGPLTTSAARAKVPATTKEAATIR